MTATEASRNFAALLDAVQAGEEILVTREGRPVARILPDRTTVAERLAAALAAHPADPGFGDDLERARRDIREFFVDDEVAWSDD